jgi:sigma-B regulation protein RsbU (phosphoserine phosphatase)
MRPILPPSSKVIQDVISTLKEKVVSREAIVKKFCAAVTQGIGFPDISLALLNPSDGSTALVHSTLDPQWLVPIQERDWLSTQVHIGKQSGAAKPETLLYITDRHTQSFVDKSQREDDMRLFEFDCKDGIYISLVSDDQQLLGVAMIHGWREQRHLDADPQFQERLQLLHPLSDATAIALDTLLVHQRIEGLLSDKRELKKRIQRDEEDLKRRLLELTVLYDTSNSLGHSLNYTQIVGIVMDALGKVLHFDICTIFLLDFVPGGEIITRLSRDIAPDFITSAQRNIIAATTPFVKRGIAPDQVKTTISQVALPHIKIENPPIMRSFANVPLIFKEDVIGMLNVCSTLRNAFTRNEMTFLHTMANQLSANLGRLKIIKRLERSKMDALIRSMTDGVIMMDEADHLEIINPAAQDMLRIKNPSTEAVLERLGQMKLQTLYWETAKSGAPSLEQEISYKSTYFSVNIVPVFDSEDSRVGTVLVFRDFTELHKINKVNSQRLEVISKVDAIIRSISDLDGLLTLLMEFIMTVANAEMGAIQLLNGRTFQTRVHSNFPDKIRREYKFISGETLSEYTAKTRQLCLIENYLHNPKVNHHVKILIDSYICIPIMAKEQSIGLLNIARRYGTDHVGWSQDDIKTLTTITNLSGTAIHNAILYQETLKKQKLDQELKIANEIQTKLLPENIPQPENASIGAISVPAREIGGDYYDFFELDHGKLGICIADIVGKGVPAGLYMAMLKSILHTHLIGISSPKEALQKINLLLFRDPVIQKFVPLFYAILDPATKTLVYANAGHEPAVLFRQGYHQVLDTEGFPLGALAESRYEEKTIPLEEGDTLLLFTDGFIESRNAHGLRFEIAQAQDVVDLSPDVSSAVFLEKLYTQLKQHLDPIEASDDVTLVAIRMNTGATPKAEIPLRVKKIRVTSAKRFVKRIRSETESIAADMGFSEDDIFNLKLAINEAQANVIEHAYFGSEKGDILFEFRVFSDRLEILIKDFGPGISSKTIKGENHLDALEGSGLGVFLIKTMIDTVKYNRTSKVGTELCLTKYLKKGVAHGNH